MLGFEKDIPIQTAWTLKIKSGVVCLFVLILLQIRYCDTDIIIQISGVIHKQTMCCQNNIIFFLYFVFVCKNSSRSL